MINTRTEKVIAVEEWNALVQKTYGRTYSFHQQDGCKERQRVGLKVPDTPYDFDNSSVPEEVNHEEMGVSFKAWLEREPAQKLNTTDEWDRDHGLSLWWKRNFYPDVQMVANDLYDKGLIEAGDYVIDIDW